MVYCKNCIYWDTWFKDSRSKYCTCPENIVEHNTPLRKEERIHDTSYHEIANATNNCMWYRKKLGRFWVKEKGNDLPPDLLPFWKWAKEIHPDLIFEWMLTEDKNASRPPEPPLSRNASNSSPSVSMTASPSVSASVSVRPNKPPPTPNPSGGKKRLIGLGGII